MHEDKLAHALHDIAEALRGLTSLHRIEAKLDHLHQDVLTVIKKENTLMALGQDLLARITAEGTVIDSIKALIDGLVSNGTIDATTAAAITAQLDQNDAKLTAAIQAGTPPPPPTP